MKVSIGRIGSTGYRHLLAILAAYDLSLDDIKSWGSKIVYQPETASISMIGDGLIEGKIHSTATLPSSRWAALGKKVALKIITPKEKYAMEKLLKMGYAEGVIPAGTYNFVPKDLPTIMEPDFIALRSDIDDEIVYHVARALWEQRKFLGELHPSWKEGLTKERIRSLAQQFGDMLHPGARKYWKEIGIIE